MVPARHSARAASAAVRATRITRADLARVCAARFLDHFTADAIVERVPIADPRVSVHIVTVRRGFATRSGATAALGVAPGGAGLLHDRTARAVAEPIAVALAAEVEPFAASGVVGRFIGRDAALSGWTALRESSRARVDLTRLAVVAAIAADRVADAKCHRRGTDADPCVPDFVAVQVVGLGRGRVAWRIVCARVGAPRIGLVAALDRFAFAAECPLGTAVDETARAFRAAVPPRDELAIRPVADVSLAHAGRGDVPRGRRAHGPAATVDDAVLVHDTAVASPKGPGLKIAVQCRSPAARSRRRDALTAGRGRTIVSGLGRLHLHDRIACRSPPSWIRLAPPSDHEHAERQQGQDSPP